MVKTRAVFECHKRRWSRVRSDPVGIIVGFRCHLSLTLKNVGMKGGQFRKMTQPQQG